MLAAIYAVAEGVLPEPEQHARRFYRLLRLIPCLPLGETILPELIESETGVLSDLGYGLDLSACATTGRAAGLIFVSPRTGRAVTPEGQGRGRGGWCHSLASWSDQPRLIVRTGGMAGA